MEVLFNPWVIGIGTTVVGGLVLYYIFGIGRVTDRHNSERLEVKDPNREEFKIELESFRNYMVRKGLAHSYLRKKGEADLRVKYGIKAEENFDA